MNTFLVSTLCFAAVFAAPAPQRFDFGSPGALLGSPSALWNAQSSILDDFEQNLRRMREEFDQLDKALESGFKFPSVELFENGTNIFEVDPSKVKNESFSDTKIVDGKVVHTEEKVISHGNSVVHFKKVEISPKDHPAQPSGDGEGAGEPKKVSKKPVSHVPATSTSKNEIDTEHEDADADANSNATRDVEEIDSIEPLESSVVPTTRKLKSDEVDEINDNYLDGSDRNVRPSTVVDLTDDTKVNDILSERIASGSLVQPEPDAEIIEFDTNHINGAPDNAAQKSTTTDDSDGWSNYNE